MREKETLMSGSARAQEVERDEARRRDAAAQQVNERKELRSIARGHRHDKLRVMKFAIDQLLDLALECDKNLAAPRDRAAALELREMARKIPRFNCDCGLSYDMHRAHDITCTGPLSRSSRTSK